mgnify:CR=1 FL=1|jgi:hypothetical protein
MKIIQLLLTLFSFTIYIYAEGSSSKHWYRGNTHTHTTKCNHADSSPDFVAQWYHDHNYNFLVLSEHNYFIDPKTVTIKDQRDDFILVPGIELTEKVHSTALNVKELVKRKSYPKGTSIKEMIQSHVDRINDKGGECILNHPNFKWTVVKEDLLGIKNLPLFELFNGHPHVHSHGDEHHPSTEAMWDFLLSKGIILYGVSSDDAHHFQAKNISPKKSNPGRGWVMVGAKSLTPDAITESLKKGEFYASNGVFLDICDREGAYSVSIDREATLSELKSPLLRGKKVQEGELGFKIEWISKNGKVLRTSKNLTDQYSDKFDTYLRAKITYTRKFSGGLEEFYAWTQPKF